MNVTNKANLLIILLLLAGQLAAADYGVTPQEKKLCQALLDARGLKGPHLCNCVRFYHRAMKEKGDTPARRHSIDNALNNCDYFLRHTPESHNARPFVHVQIAKIYRLSRNYKEAIPHLRKAIAINPKYDEPYYYLGKIFSKLGNQKEALAIVEEGLRLNPNSKLLKRGLERLAPDKQAM